MPFGGIILYFCQLYYFSLPFQGFLMIHLALTIDQNYYITWYDG